jgi:hypothetical protein
MSLDVSPELIEQAERGEIDEREFVRAVATSLPYAWTVVTRVAGRLHDGETGPAGFAEDATPPPSEAERGQLLRALASDSIRGSLERHFQVRLAFQNCHRVAAFELRDANGAAHREFTSPRAQVLNQTPALRHC